MSFYTHCSLLLKISEHCANNYELPITGLSGERGFEKIKSVQNDPASHGWRKSPTLKSKGLSFSFGFAGSSDGKASAYNVGDPSSIPGLGRSPGEGNGNPLQYSCLENPMDRGSW